MRSLEHILTKLNYPKDLKSLSEEELVIVCSEIRLLIIDVLCGTSGHFGASLGAVELAVAIHSIFETPNDKLIWDVGHQAYAHKIITGRREEFVNLRKKDCISGFPKRNESEYDSFGTGHSSTSISAISGMAVAAMLRDEKRSQHIAVIGDGALTGGMAFEALNNLSELEANILVIINDNHMSIDPNIGGLEKHLFNIKESKENFFQNLGLNFIGSVNGNNLHQLRKVLLKEKDKVGIRVLHCRTQKGYGYQPSETGDPTIWHAPGKFNKTSGILNPSSNLYPKKYQDIFGECLVELAKENESIVAVTPAMMSGSSLSLFREKFPLRFFDVGIAEQHAVTFSAGLAANGMLPFCVIYSSFLQRGYDQLIHDVALQNLPVVFCIDRAGLVGEDGATHHGVFDISFLRCIPNIIIMSPLNEQDFVDMLYTIQLNPVGPVAIRYPRGKGVMNKAINLPKKIVIGKGSLVKEGENIAILSLGSIGNEVTKAINILKTVENEIAHFDMRFVKPLDEELLHEIFKKFPKIITIEDGVKKGGFGSSILEFKAMNDYTSKIDIIGIPDRFIEHGTKDELQQEAEIDYQTLVEKIKSYF